MTELIVVIAILVIITSVILLQGRTSRSELELTNVAYEVALLVREAQSYGSATREVAVGLGEFDIAYGVYVDMGSDATKLTLFEDADKDGNYRTGTVTAVKELNLRGGYTVSDICGIDTSEVEQCDNYDYMSIGFVRPYLDAYLFGGPASGTLLGSKLVISNDAGQARTVYVYTTGQISVQ